MLVDNDGDVLDHFFGTLEEAELLAQKLAKEVNDLVTVEEDDGLEPF